MRNLELGCGKNPNREICNVFHDIIKHSEFVNYTCDLNQFPWTLPQGEFDLVYSNQVMEHMKADVKDWMDELWKILKVGGRTIIRVPHFTNPHFFIDPTHHRWFSEGTMDYFDKTTLRGDLYGKIYWSKSRFWWRKLKEYRIEGDVIFEMQKLPEETA
jgi:SAM-dependent methyltransferase